MKKIFYSLFLCLSILILFSCEKEFLLKSDSIPFIVVNSFFSSDSIFKVNLTKSLDIFDKEDVKFIDNANIILYEDNQFIGTFIYKKDGNYILNYIPQSNKSYNLSVISDLGNISATNSIPSKPSILKIDTSTVIKNYSKEIECLISFEDNLANEDYYIIDVQTIAGYYSIEFPIGKPDTTYFTESIDFNYDDKIIENKIGINGFSYGVVFSDKLFNGKKISIKIFLDIYNLQVKLPNTIKFYLKSISKDYYLYAKSYSRLINQDDEILSEPVQVYSNIQNGFGIFGGYSQDMDSIVYK